MAVPVNELFCAADADITLQSSDKVLFKVHRRNLAAYSEAFPGEEVPSAGEIVHLSENSATLELLLQFMAKQRHPIVRGLPFNTVAPLAEAAEKYQVYSAVSVCHLYMQDNLRIYPLGVLNYAMRHDYPTLCDGAAPLTVDEPLDIALEILGPMHFISWVKCSLP
ncbi:hypothetical protein OF83DRAFT_96974 [Amylostereum chailletii]|nr:hypothetical protein OF83DRAFT_96974 [Amylostereum chailletii]